MRLESIQVLRGIAASLVFVFHLVVTVDRYSPADLRQWVEFGQFGVDLFFVISGFVMAHSIRDLAGWKDASVFLVRRFWRIAPLLYILAVAHIFLASVRSNYFDLAQIVNCFTIIPMMESPAKFQYALIPAWTLGFELMFYVFIAGAVALSGSAWWAAIPIALLTFGPGQDPLGSTLMIEFIYGLIAYALWKRGVGCKPAWLLAAAALTVAFPLSGARFVAWGIPAALIFVATLTWEPGNRPLEQKAKWLGMISYSLYLSHVVAFDAVAPLASPFGLVPLAIILAGTGLLTAWFVYETVEAPLWRMGTTRSLKLVAQT